MHAFIAGFYLGYESKDRHRVWVERSFKEFQNVTRKGGDYQTLAIKLLEFFFVRSSKLQRSIVALKARRKQH